MNKPQGYDDAEVKIFNNELPVGPHICYIAKAYDATSKSGNEMLVLDLEIKEGEFAGYFGKKQRKDKPWPMKHYIVNNEENAGRFKGNMTAVEHSNPGYVWNWEPETLVGKLVGCNFREEEYVGKEDGKTYTSIKSGYLFTAKDVASQKPLKKKTVEAEKKPVDENLLF